MAKLTATMADTGSFAVAGDFDAVATQKLKGTLEKLAATHEADLILDLTAVDFIDSSGIGAIAFLFKRMRARGHRLFLKGVHGQPRKVITMVGIDRTVSLI